MRDHERSWFAPALSLITMLALSAVPLPTAVAPFKPDWVVVIMIYWSLASPGRFSLFTAFWMGLALDTLSGALLGQHALALLIVVYLAERFHLRLRVFPVSQVTLTVTVLLALYEFILFCIDGVAGRTVPPIERWAPVLTGTVVWLFLVALLDRHRREASARF
jgi:rod shape-determining protein MreD